MSFKTLSSQKSYDSLFVSVVDVTTTESFVSKIISPFSSKFALNSSHSWNMSLERLSFLIFLPYGWLIWEYNLEVGTSTAENREIS